jgi:hypothetical protein
VHQALRAPGRPLDPATRAFMEPRLGADFGAVRVHTGLLAEASADAVGAQAYTVGHDIVFSAARFDPTSKAGRHLLAHELTHVRQQAESTGSPPLLQRTLRVVRPSDNIPNPTGSGAVLTNAEQVSRYLSVICDSSFAGITVATGGTVQTSLCDDPTLIPAVVDRTVQGCACLCDVINSQKMITIAVDDAADPHTHMGAGAVQPGVGSNADIFVWSENSPRVSGAPTVSGRLLETPDWLVLGHEMCGHAWLGMQGRELPGPWTGLPPHVPGIERENVIRAEHDMEARAVWYEPYCGEGYVYNRGDPAPATAEEAETRYPSFLDNCIAWRESLNWFNCTSYTVADRIPDRVPNLCPPDGQRA